MDNPISISKDKRKNIAIKHMTRKKERQQKFFLNNSRILQYEKYVSMRENLEFTTSTEFK